MSGWDSVRKAVDMVEDRVELVGVKLGGSGVGWDGGRVDMMGMVGGSLG